MVRATEWILHGLALAVCLATLVLVGQPLFANDTWIHLALGEAFGAMGPWLERDPFLFAAPGPPAPSSWLGSLAIFRVYDVAGFTGLRVFHVLAVGLILALAWESVRRATRSVAMASAGLVLFILLSTYRIVQLRPHLWTIGAMLAVYCLVLAPRDGPRRAGVVLATGIAAIWANVHAAFLLGPILVLGVSASLFAWSWLPGMRRAAPVRKRAQRVGIAGIGMFLGSLLNPLGVRAHLAYFSSGQDTLALNAVIDEWGSTHLLAWPIERLPPTLAAWWLCWLCVLGLIWGAFVLIADWRASATAPTTTTPVVTTDSEQELDPALFALSVASVVAALVASRFLWLCLFPATLLLCLLSRAAARGGRLRPAAGIVVGAVLLAAFGHFKVGDWPLVSRALSGSRESYAQPYWAPKYFGHSMWFLADTRVHGRIFNDYPLGGFMSFWLSPGLKMASSGTMNVRREAMEAHLALAAGRGVRPGESFAALLDRQGFDLFLGTGLPVAGPASRPVGSTVRYLENEPAWVPVFRSLRSAVYLRRNERNAENLERIEDYYEAAGVPFDSSSGFDPERVIGRNPNWAKAHGLIPSDFERRLSSIRAELGSNRVSFEAGQLASLYAVLGVYDRAIALDRTILRLDRANVEAAQRLIWSLLNAGRDEAAVEAAGQLERGPLGGGQTGGWLSAVNAFLSGPVEDRPVRLGQLPLLSVTQGRWLQQGLVAPQARESRSPSVEPGEILPNK